MTKLHQFCLTLNLSIAIILLISCSSGNCRKNQDLTLAPTDSQMTKSDSVADKVKVFKYDGSLQCAMGKTIPLEEMQKELKNIKVYSAHNKADGLMHIMVCGSPTGKANVYEIDRVHLQEALKRGFKEWTFD